MTTYAEATDKTVETWKSSAKAMSERMESLVTMPSLDFVEPVERYFDYLQRAVDLNRELLTRWAELVGPEIALHCRPESFEDSVVRVRTSSTAWATQLRLMSPVLLQRFDEALGPGVVTRIDVAGPQAPSWRKGPRTVRGGRGPRDTYG